MTLASKLGYAPTGLGTFLTRLTDRNKTSTEKRGLFASHPAMKERLTKLDEVTARDKLSAPRRSRTATRSTSRTKRRRSPRSRSWWKGRPAWRQGGGARTEAKAEEEEGGQAERRKRGSDSVRSGETLGGDEKKTAQVTASGGARGVDPEVGAKGGPNPAPVPVTVTAADLAAFKKEGKLALGA